MKVKFEVYPLDNPLLMGDSGELRSCREERMENGVKKLIGSEAISQKLILITEGEMLRTKFKYRIFRGV